MVIEGFKIFESEFERMCEHTLLPWKADLWFRIKDGFNVFVKNEELKDGG